MELPNDIESLIELASPDLREITFHTDGRVIAKTGGRAKYPKRLYNAKPKEGLTGWSPLVVEALKKLITNNHE